jgi:hypothetical protein
MAEIMSAQTITLEKTNLNSRKLKPHMNIPSITDYQDIVLIYYCIISITWDEQPKDY